MSYLYHMDRMRKIEDRSNPMVDQIKVLIAKSFPPALGMRVEYFTGEDEDTQIESIVFHLNSSALGSIYKKTLKLNPDRFSEDDVEPDFVGAILSDFMLLGTTFLTNNVMFRKATQKEDATNILVGPYSRGKLNHNNLN